jgi:hypothetical protein
MTPEIRQEPKTMWAILHVPSGSWDNGDAKLMLYPFQYEARLACPNESFVPVKVIVRPAKVQL